MGTLRAGFGRYELGSQEGDGARINFMQKLEEKNKSGTDAFRVLIDNSVAAEGAKAGAKAGENVKE